MTRDHPLRRSTAALMLLVSATALGADLELDPAYGLRGLGDTVGAYGDRLAGSSYGYTTFPPAQLLHPDGSVLFAGTDANGRMLLLRIAPGGAVDRAFGREGTVELPLGRGSVGMALARDGGLLIAGAAPGESACGRRVGLTPPTPPGGGTVAAKARVVKLRPDGTLDPRFGTAGIADIDLPTLSGPPNVVRTAVERGGRIRIVAGCDATGGGLVNSSANAVVSSRLDAAGRADASFAIATTGRFGLPVTLALLDDDTAFVLTAEPEDELDDFTALHRFAADGRYDRVINDPSITRPVHWRAIAASAQALYVAVTRGADGAVLRLGSDGAHDRSFGVEGDLVLPAPSAWLPGTVSMYTGGLVIDTDGSVLAAGAATEPSGNLIGGLLLTRFSAQGVRDRDLGRDGYAYVALPGEWYGGVDMARDGAGNLLLATGEVQTVGQRLPQTARLRVLAPGGLSASPGLVSLGVGFLSAREGDGPLTVRVYRTGGRRGAASVEYATRDGSALAGADYQATQGRLDWADGDDTPRSIELRVLDDAVIEPVESFRLELQRLSGAQAGRPSTTFVNIQGPSAAAPAAPSTPSAGGSGAGAASAGGGGGALGTATLAALLLLALAGSRRRFSVPRSDTAGRCRSDAPRRGSGRAGAATSGRNSRRGSRRRARSARR